MIVIKNMFHYYENKTENYLKNKKNILNLMVKILNKLKIQKNNPRKSVKSVSKK